MEGIFEIQKFSYFLGDLSTSNFRTWDPGHSSFQIGSGVLNISYNIRFVHQLKSGSMHFRDSQGSTDRKVGPRGPSDPVPSADRTGRGPPKFLKKRTRRDRGPTIFRKRGPVRTADRRHETTGPRWPESVKNNFSIQNHSFTTQKSLRNLNSKTGYLKNVVSALRGIHKISTLKLDVCKIHFGHRESFTKSQP